MPNDAQAGVYSATLHHLQSVQAAGTDDGFAVMVKMHQLPIDDMFAKHGVLREDGTMAGE